MLLCVPFLAHPRGNLRELGRDFLPRVPAELPTSGGRAIDTAPDALGAVEVGTGHPRVQADPRDLPTEPLGQVVMVGVVPFVVA